MAMTAAERQKRYRAKQGKTVTRNVTKPVTETVTTVTRPTVTKAQSYNPMMVGYVPPRE